MHTLPFPSLSKPLKLNMSSLYHGHVFNEVIIYYHTCGNMADGWLLWSPEVQECLSHIHWSCIYVTMAGNFLRCQCNYTRVLSSRAWLLHRTYRIPLKLSNRHPFAFSLFMLPWLYHFTANPKLDLLMYLLASPCWILIFLSFINYFGSYFSKRFQCYLGWSCAEFPTLRWSNWITLRFSGKSLVACRSLIYRTTSCLLTLLGPSENLQSWNKSKILTWTNTSTWGYIVKSSSLEFFF